jgi:mannose-6-phosphate isomerase-like protein (cupin superfamily)
MQAPSITAVIPSAAPVRGVVVPAGGGEHFVYCNRPVTLWLKVDSVTAPHTQLVAGTGEVRGDEGIGRHRGAHEVIYVRSGWGHAIVGVDTTNLGPGSVMYVPPGTRHRLVSSGTAPLDYFWVIAPMSSGAGFRRAAMIGCPGGPPASVTTPSAQPEPEREEAGLVLAPGAGERLTYCVFPLTITFKVDSVSVPGSRLVAATGALRRGSEVGEHAVDEVVLITHGRGFAFVGADTMPVQSGSIMYTPRGMRHGFINDTTGTLEYVVVYGPFEGPRSRAGFRRLASQPGPSCPAQGVGRLQ